MAAVQPTPRTVRSDVDTYTLYNNIKEEMKNSRCPMNVKAVWEASFADDLVGEPKELDKGIRVKNFCTAVCGSLATVVVRVLRIAIRVVFFPIRCLYLAGEVSRFNLNRHNDNGTMVENGISEHRRECQRIRNEFIDLKNTFKAWGYSIHNIFVPSGFRKEINEMVDYYHQLKVLDDEDDRYITAKQTLRNENKNISAQNTRAGVETNKDHKKDEIKLPPLRSGVVEIRPNAFYAAAKLTSKEVELQAKVVDERRQAQERKNVSNLLAISEV